MNKPIKKSKRRHKYADFPIPSLGNWLTAKPMSVNKLASLSGIDVSALSRKINGKKRVFTTDILRIHAVTGIGFGTLTLEFEASRLREAVKRKLS